MGKGHTGYKSFYHLPLQLGFDEWTGFLGGAQVRLFFAHGFHETVFGETL
jgi:hypothetical protein